MASVTAFEAKTRFGQLLERVARGEEVVITKHDKPVARLIPEGPRDLKAVRKAATGLRALRQQIAIRNKNRTNPTAAEIKSWIEEGRR
jgi:prevent-host-death family protein